MSLCRQENPVTYRPCVGRPGHTGPHWDGIAGGIWGGDAHMNVIARELREARAERGALASERDLLASEVIELRRALDLCGPAFSPVMQLKDTTGHQLFDGSCGCRTEDHEGVEL